MSIVPAITLINKKIIYAGSKNAKFTNGTKVFFHFQTRLCDEEKTIIDDSRKMGTGKPMELVLGKKFKMEVWETVIQNMSINEVATFNVDKSLVTQYPFVSKTLRDSTKPYEQRQHHCCGAILQNEGVGYKDLNEMIKNPTNLEFTIAGNSVYICLKNNALRSVNISVEKANALLNKHLVELLKVEAPGDYQKDSWQLTEEEKLKMVPVLQERGNVLFRNSDYKAASDTYGVAIGYLEQLVLKEKPNDEDWLILQKQKIPLLLNFSQCKLNQGEYYPVIEHCTSVLKIEPENVKALFRRAKAHVGAWNPREARQDFEKVMELDSSLTNAVKKELKDLDQKIKERDKEEKEKLKNLF